MKSIRKSPRCPGAVFSQALDGILEVEEDGETRLIDAEAGVATLLGGAAGHVARDEVAESRVATLQVEVAVLIGDVIGGLLAEADGLSVLLLLGDPDAAVVAERLGHEGELGLDVSVDGDAGGVDLAVAGVGEIGALAVSLHGGGAVGPHGVGGEEICVAITAGADDHGMGEISLDGARDEVADNDAARAAIDDDDVEHLAAGEELDRAVLDLLREGGVGAEEELLARLTLGVERAGDLRSAEGAVGEEAAVLARERHALGHALVDDVVRHLREAIYVGLAGAVVAALDGVIEEAVYGVAVVLIVLGGVYATLRGNGVRATRAILDAEIEDVKAHLAERGRRGRASQAGAYDDDVELALVGGVDQFLVGLVVGPLLGQQTLRDF